MGVLIDCEITICAKMRRAQSISARQCAKFRCVMWFCAPRRRIESQRSGLKVTNSRKKKGKVGVSGTCLEAA
jgi:hypothetical protein